MPTVEQYLKDYGVSHQNPTNQIIHIICVPVIFFACIAMAYVVPLASWTGLVSESSASWFNLATLLAIPMLVFYALLGLRSLIIGAAWFGVSLAACIALEGINAPLLEIAIAVFVIAWIGQFIGHKVEGAKPSFFKDIFFLLIGPLFVQQEFNHWVKTGSLGAQL